MDRKDFCSYLDLAIFYGYVIERTKIFISQHFLKNIIECDVNKFFIKILKKKTIFQLTTVILINYQDFSKVHSRIIENQKVIAFYFNSGK